MLASKIIEIDGVFLGTAIVSGNSTGLRFYAAHESVRVLHNVVEPDLVGLSLQVAHQFRRHSTAVTAH